MASNEERQLSFQEVQSHLLEPEQQRAAQAEQLALLPTVWQTIYGDGPGVVGLLSGQRDGRHLVHPQEAYYAWPRDAAAAAAWVAAEAEQDRDVYHCAHLLLVARRRKQAAAPLASLYVDLDHSHLPAQVTEPTLIIESSPGKWQCYWRLSEPVPPAVGERHNRQLAQAVGADKTGWDLTQLLRIPGTMNHKYSDAPLVRVVAITGKQYDIEQLTASLPAQAPVAPRQPAVASPRPAAPRGADAGQPPVYLSGYAKRIWEGVAVKYTPDGQVDRSASLLRIARILYGARLSRAAIIAALVERDVALGWKKYTEREDAQEQYERIVDYIEAHR